MLFKVVSTLEKNRQNIVAVPASWESSNILMWPDNLLTKQRELLRCDELSIPDEGWSAYRCNVKVKVIATFKEALEIEKKLIKCMTDEEESVIAPIVARQKTKNFFVDRTEMFGQANESSYEQNVGSANSQPEDNLDALNNVIIENVYSEPETNDQEVRNILLDVSTSLNKLNIKVEGMEKKIETMEEWFLKISICLDKIIENQKKQTLTKAKAPKVVKASLLTEYKFPIGTEENLLALEKALEIKEVYIEMTNLMTSFCGKSGEEEGTKVGYKIVDRILCPILLTGYSWTGISKNKDKNVNAKKKPFQLHENLIASFTEAISAADSRWTRQKTINFFKDGVLKHSKKRCQRKGTLKKIQDPNTENKQDQPGQSQFGEDENQMQQADNDEMENLCDVEVYSDDGNGNYLKAVAKVSGSDGTENTNLE